MAKQLKLFNAHKNSIEAYYSIRESGARLTRCQQIIGLMLDEKPRTDRIIMIELGFTDMNAVRPRITELVKAGTLEEVGTLRDPATDKNVRIVKLVTDKEFEESEV